MEFRYGSSQVLKEADHRGRQRLARFPWGESAAFYMNLRFWLQLATACLRMRQAMINAIAPLPPHGEFLTSVVRKQAA